MSEPEKASADKKSTERSPRYPFISLKEAVERARQFHKEEGRNAAMPEIAAKHWGYSSKSSGGRQTLAALRSFGLMENSGASVKLSDKGLKIVLDQRDPSPERLGLLRELALLPPAHRILWDRFKADLPSEANLSYTLMIDFHFAEGGVADLVREYKETLAYAELSGPATLVQPAEANVSAPTKPSTLAVGDQVNWESEGVLQNSRPLLIREISADGSYALVEGSNTGLPVPQLTRIEGAERASLMTLPMVVNQGQSAGAGLTPLVSGFKQDVFTLTEGDVVLRWPDGLSKESFGDLRDWLEIMQKKIARAAGVDLRAL